VPTQDDVPVRSEDAEWALKSYATKARSLGPLTRQMHQYCRDNAGVCAGLMSFGPDGEPTGAYPCGSELAFFEPPRLLELSMQIESKIGARLVAVSRKAGATPWTFIVPSKDYFAPGAENDMSCKDFNDVMPKALEAALDAQGMRAFDLTEAVRTLEPQLFPLWSKKDGHFVLRGHQWLGFIMATKFLEMEAQQK
jgi:hypothetical protein